MSGHHKSKNWLYGLNPVLEALKAGRKIKAVYVYSGRHKDIDVIRRETGGKGIELKAVEMSFFDARFPKGHQGVAAEVFEMAYTPFDELLMIPAEKGEAPFFLILDEIEDPRNLGAILRSAEAAGVHGVVIQRHRQAGITPVTVKASAGAVEYIPICMVPNIKNAIMEMKKEGIIIVGAEGGGRTTPYDIDLKVPLVLVIGSEGKGLRLTVREKCDYLASLPMKGSVDSLNASVAAGVFLYEVLRQRSRKN